MRVQHPNKVTILLCLGTFLIISNSWYKSCFSESVADAGRKAITKYTVTDSKLSATIGCLRTRVRKQPIIELYFESETGLKIYNLDARYLA